jgi:hypothetical protein
MQRRRLLLERNDLDGRYEGSLVLSSYDCVEWTCRKVVTRDAKVPFLVRESKRYQNQRATYTRDAFLYECRSFSVYNVTTDITHC